MRWDWLLVAGFTSGMLWLYWCDRKWTDLLCAGVLVVVTLLSWWVHR